MSFRNYRQCKYCSRSYFYTGAFITHLRDKHAERVKYIAEELLPDEGYRYENNYVLIPNIPQPAVLPPDSDIDDDSRGGPSDVSGQPFNQESESVDDRNDTTPGPNTEGPPTVLGSRFETLREREPGKALENEADGLDTSTYDEQSNNPEDWYPFCNEKEYRFAEWVVKHRISKTAVDELLKSPAIQGDHTFRSAYLLFKKIDNMTYDLGMHTWKSGRVSFDRSNQNAGNQLTQFYYRDPVPCIEFLLRQTAYKEHMTYAPVKEYNEQNERVYLELHTGDWWWRMQVFFPGPCFLLK